MLAEFAQRWPEMPVVIDHGAKPRIAAGEIDSWSREISALGRFPQVHCKLSGLRTEQASGAPARQLEPYIRHLGKVFADRLMWGSDWPVLLHSGDRYEDWLSTVLEWAGAAQTATVESLLHGAAERFYGLE
jgi:L-fuconolactonase